MRSLDPTILGIFFGVSELGLLLSRRSRGGAQSADRGSLSLLWVVIVLSIVGANLCTLNVAAANSPLLTRLVPLGETLFVAGLICRWYAIWHLGRFFTVNVAIAADHRVVDTGSYRWIRHPSYTGALLAFVGLGICYRNWLGLSVLVIPTTLAFLRRIQIEEAALLAALGESYAQYRARTWRLIPFVY